MNVGERIKRAREALRLSQAALAEAVGVQTNTVWRWENQRATPDVEAISQIAQTLGVLRSLRGKMLCRLWLGVTPLWCFR